MSPVARHLTLLGYSLNGVARSDVAAARGARYLNSGYNYVAASQPPGWNMFLVSAHSTTSGAWTARTVNAYVDIPTDAITISRSGTGTGAISASPSGLTCPGGSTTQAVPCAASYALGTVVTMTAIPDSGSTFGGSGGACAAMGTSPTCAVALNGDRYAFATFVKTPTSVTTNYYHTDLVGSVRAITDQAGATVIRR